jgi:hypothetical protein
MKTLEQRLKAVAKKRHRRQLARWRLTGKLPKPGLVHDILAGDIAEPNDAEQDAIFAYLRHRDVNPKAWGSLPRLAFWELVGGAEHHIEPSALARIVMGNEDVLN